MLYRAVIISFLNMCLFYGNLTVLKCFLDFLILNLLNYFKSISAYSRYLISKYAHTNTNHGVYEHVVTPEIWEHWVTPAYGIYKYFESLLLKEKQLAHNSSLRKTT